MTDVDEFFERVGTAVIEYRDVDCSCRESDEACARCQEVTDTLAAGWMALGRGDMEKAIVLARRLGELLDDLD